MVIPVKWRFRLSDCVPVFNISKALTICRPACVDNGDSEDVCDGHYFDSAKNFLVSSIFLFSTLPVDSQ